MLAPEIFPKASAKVRQFRELTKFFQGFFQKICNFFTPHAAEVLRWRGAGSTDYTGRVQKNKENYNLNPKKARARHLFWLTTTTSSSKMELFITRVAPAK